VLHCVLQPQCDKHNQVVCSELLLRWQSAEMGFISPAVFIAIAEESDAIVSLSRFTIERACQYLQWAKQQGIKTRIAVNISARFLTHSSFLGFVTDTVSHYRLSPEQLMLEITEGTVIGDVSLVKMLMTRLRDKGFTFSVDDFGTGYSSMSYLNELDISEIKIDKSFVAKIASSEQGRDSSIVPPIIDMGKAIGAQVVGEGVETEAQRRFLFQHGCDLVQGYWLHKPLAIADWQALLLNARSDKQG